MCERIRVRTCAEDCVENCVYAEVCLHEHLTGTFRECCVIAPSQLQNGSNFKSWWQDWNFHEEMPFSPSKPIRRAAKGGYHFQSYSCVTSCCSVRICYRTLHVWALLYHPLWSFRDVFRTILLQKYFKNFCRRTQRKKWDSQEFGAKIATWFYTEAD